MYLFQHQNKGTPPCTSCNVQVYNVRIPAEQGEAEAFKAEDLPGFRGKPQRELLKSEEKTVPIWGGAPCSGDCPILGVASEYGFPDPSEMNAMNLKDR